MHTLMLAASFGTVALTIGLVSVSVLLIGLILLQKNRGSGLSGAFGGVGGHTAFGTKTGDMLTWVTVSLVAIFLLLAIVGNYVFDTTKPAVAAPSINPAPAVPADGSIPISSGATPGKPIPMTVTPSPGAPQTAPMNSAPVPVKINPPPTTQPG